MKDKHDQSTIDWVDAPSRTQCKQLLHSPEALLTPAECERLVEVLEQQLEQSNRLSRISNKTLAHS